MSRFILVTGANKGIGRALVEAILTDHADAHVFLGSRDPARGQAARQALVEAHPDAADRLEVVALDVTDGASVAAAARHVADRVGDAGLYGLVNNAGIGLGDRDTATVLDVNVHGPRRVCDHFLALMTPGGRVVNVSSASGPNFVAACSPEVQRRLTRADVRWPEVQHLLDRAIALADPEDFTAAGLRDDAYGLSKAALNALTLELARTWPELTVHSCTPGFIETDLTRPFAEARGIAPSEMGMKAPADGTRAALHILFDPQQGTGWYFGSDAQRSPLDRYRSPGDPPFAG